MGKSHIKIYVDTVSPFGYMGYWFVRNSPIFESVEVEYVPILLGGLMKQCSNTPPLMVKNKDKWINRDRLSWARQFKIPMREQVPTSFPAPTISAQRLLTALSQHNPALLPVALDTLYTAFWSPDSLPPATPPPSITPDYNMNNIDDLRNLLSQPSVLGTDLTAQLLDAIGTAEVKQALGDNTDAAFEDGAFGLPWFHCTNEAGETVGFWGFDHLGQVVRFLGLEDGRGALRPLL